MKYSVFTIIALLFLLVDPYTLFAQKELQKVKIELTNPSKRGSLELHIHSGTITVIGQDRNDVEVGFTQPKKDKGEESRGKLKRISTGLVDMEITEHNNEIDIDTDNNRTDFVVHVPRDFDLSLRTHHNSEIVVENVNGQLEVQGHHGGIALKNIGGSVSAETHHGDIHATFSSVDEGRPMAFSTYHGDVDVTLPSATNCNMKIKPGKGDIFTDFELSFLPNQRSERVDKRGAKEIKLGGWVSGDIGSGGKEFMFTTYHGDIIIRKA